MSSLYNCLDYYNILGYKSKYIVVKNNYFFTFFSLFFDYLPYYFLRILYIFNSKKYKLMSKLMNFSSISNIFHYYTHNTWYINSYKMKEIFNKNYYHKVIIPKGINKYILKTELNFYPILNCKNHSYFDILWLINRSKNSPLLTNLTAYILRKVFKQIFSEIYIDIEKIIEIISKLDKKTNLVLCPTHRTYCDFLIISYILFELKDLGVKLPKIAAAIEFKNIPFIGKIFENLGCFFIKRGTGKDMSVNKKINNIMENNENIEFFVEGTRSRTRQYLPFKTGLVRALQETGKNYKILPITISYEKIPEQNNHFLEILSNKKQKMSLLDLSKWVYKLNTKNISYGNVYIKFSETINLKPNYNPHNLLPKIMREFQLNTISTNYHYKFPIYNYQNIKKSGLKDTNHSNILEGWTVMNHWIYKYLSINNAKNIWEKLYIKKYNYLLESDIIFNENTNYYHRQYFKYINYDIKCIIEYIQKFKKLDIDNLINKLYLGNIILNFVLVNMKNEKILDNDNNLIGNLKKYII
jgi:1-acyl-sn-glycerol-3-phosphate acyltransferase